MLYIRYAQISIFAIHDVSNKACMPGFLLSPCNAIAAARSAAANAAALAAGAAAQLVAYPRSEFFPDLFIFFFKLQ